MFWWFWTGVRGCLAEMCVGIWSHWFSMCVQVKQAIDKVKEATDPDGPL